MRFALLGLASLALAQQVQAQNEALRKGKLPNGLTYYIYNDGSTPAWLSSISTKTWEL